MKIKKFNDSTKVLLVTSGDDYAALNFENKYSGSKVSDIIENLSKYEGDDWELSVFEFGHIDPKFVSFIKNKIQGYDQSKNTNFYLDIQTI